MNRADIHKIVLQATEGLAQTTTDTLLFLFFLYGTSFGKRGSLGVYRSFEEAQSALGELNYQTIKRAINTLTHNKWITRSPKRSVIELEITKLGKERINAILPTYKHKRPWDGHVYLISYDISQRANSTRNLLREYIRRTGGALLQESLWINPYNPKQLLEDFTQSHHIEGSILISKLGRDGAIGNESLLDLIKRVYHLPQLAKRYKEFNQVYQKDTSPSPVTLAFAYFSILQDDPQLPYELLPKNFPAQKAYILFTHFARKVRS